MTDSGNPMTWERALALRPMRLYAGDIPAIPGYLGVVGLSEHAGDERHIRHDVRTPFPIPSESTDSFQSEDVFEHIAYDQLIQVFDEVWRILKAGGLFRLSVPDYRCDLLIARSIKAPGGRIVFDPGGGGTLQKPGHVWFPVFETVRELVRGSRFGDAGYANFLHYFDEDGRPVTNPVDYRFGMVHRTPDYDNRVCSPRRPMSLIVDLIKTSMPP